MGFVYEKKESIFDELGQMELAIQITILLKFRTCSEIILRILNNFGYNTN